MRVLCLVETGRGCSPLADGGVELDRVLLVTFRFSSFRLGAPEGGGGGGGGGGTPRFCFRLGLMLLFRLDSTLRPLVGRLILARSSFSNTGTSSSFPAGNGSLKEFIRIMFILSACFLICIVSGRSNTNIGCIFPGEECSRLGVRDGLRLRTIMVRSLLWLA